MGSNDDVKPEPQPDWDGGAKDTLGWLWPTHCYLFAALFIIVAVSTITALVVTRRSQRNTSIVKTTMLCAIITMSVCRALTLLLVDPYLSGGRTSSIWWKFCYILLTGIGTASLTAALAILLYVTTVSTRIISTCRQDHLGRVVCGISIGNFFFFTTSDVITTLFKQVRVGKIMLAICQTTFALWGIVVALGFAFLTYKLRRNAHATFEQARSNTNMKKEGDKLRKLCVLLAILSATSAVFFVLRIYEALSSFPNTFSDTWSWWGLRTVMRALEITNAIVLLFVFKRNVNKTPENDRHSRTDSEQPSCKKGSFNLAVVVSEK